MHVCMHVCIHAYTYVHACKYVCMCTYVYMYIPTKMYMWIEIWVVHICEHTLLSGAELVCFVLVFFKCLCCCLALFVKLLASLQYRLLPSPQGTELDQPPGRWTQSSEDTRIPIFDLRILAPKFHTCQNQKPQLLPTGALK